MSTSTPHLKPFLRWAGGKRWLAASLAQSIPPGVGTYYEPFLGGASLYLHAQPTRAVLSDINSDLIETYKTIRDEPRSVVEILDLWSNNQDTYYKVRSLDFPDNIHRAAQFIYLNKTCWNGLYRVNRRGRFNVPFGHHQRRVFSEDHLFAVSFALRHATIECSDFAHAINSAGTDDFVYLDPPYVSVHTSNGFRQYNESLFTWTDQERLSTIALRLADRGCHVVVSNANHQEIIDLYPDFVRLEVSRHSVLAADSRYRKRTTELIFATDSSLLPTAGIPGKRG